MGIVAYCKLNIKPVLRPSLVYAAFTFSSRVVLEFILAIYGNNLFINIAIIWFLHQVRLSAAMGFYLQLVAMVLLSEMGSLLLNMPRNYYNSIILVKLVAKGDEVICIIAK